MPRTLTLSLPMNQRDNAAAAMFLQAANRADGRTSKRQLCTIGTMTRNINSVATPPRHENTHPKIPRSIRTSRPHVHATYVPILSLAAGRRVRGPGKYSTLGCVRVGCGYRLMSLSTSSGMSDRTLRPNAFARS